MEFGIVSMLSTAIVVVISGILATIGVEPLRHFFTLLLQGRLFQKRKVYDITDLRIYPVKSCRGISLRKTRIQMHGLALDRQWMFVDAESHKFVTIRQISRMILINTNLSDDGQTLILSVGDEKVHINAFPTPEWLARNTTLEKVNIWSDETDGYMYGPEVNDVFSKFLGQDVRLVYKGPMERVLSSNAKPELLGRSQSTYFPDMMPILIASEASITELNGRLTAKGVNPITIERFRPNIIIRDNEPWSEDLWQLVRIIPSTSSASPSTGANGKIAQMTKKPLIIDVVSRCARCQVPNVDPNTAEKHKHEPWDTLMSYRRVDEGFKYKPCFGMHSVPRSEGEIEVGMQLEVLKETTEHRICH